MDAKGDLIRKPDEVAEDERRRRLIVVLCLDNSASMRGQPIAELNEGVRRFHEAALADEYASKIIETCIVSFGDGAAPVRGCCPLKSKSVPLVLTICRGEANIGEGMNLALDMIERRTQEFKAQGLYYYRPWLLLMTAGRPGGEAPKATQAAMRRIAELADSRRLNMLTLVSDSDYDMDTIKGFSSKKVFGRLNGFSFNELFYWIGPGPTVLDIGCPGAEDALVYPVTYENWPLIEL